MLSLTCHKHHMIGIFELLTGRRPVQISDASAVVGPGYAGQRLVLRGRWSNFVVDGRCSSHTRILVNVQATDRLTKQKKYKSK